MSNVLYVDFGRQPPPPPAAADDWPADPQTARIVVRSEMDFRGFQNFYVLWRDLDFSKRMQAFVGKSLAEVRDYLRDCGRDVEIVERIGETLRRPA